MKAGDRVKKRGFEALGTVVHTTQSFDFEDGEMKMWVVIGWDDGPKPKERPRICHPKELEVVNVPSGS